MQHRTPDKFRVFQTWILNHPMNKIVKLHRLFIISARGRKTKPDSSSYFIREMSLAWGIESEKSSDILHIPMYFIQCPRVVCNFFGTFRHLS